MNDAVTGRDWDGNGKDALMGRSEKMMGRGRNGEVM